MQHRNSHLLVGYWSRLRRGRPVPNQSDIDPRAIKRMLGSVFILDAQDTARPAYRLTGTQICDAYGYELKGSNFLNQWDANIRSAIGQLLCQALAMHQPVCLTALGTTEGGGAVEIEIVLAPVGMGAGGVTRFIGLMQTQDDAQQPAKRPIISQRLTCAELVREDLPAERPAKPQAPSAPRERRRPQLRLVVSRSHPAREAGVAAERDVSSLFNPRQGSRPRLICLKGGLQSA